MSSSEKLFKNDPFVTYFICIHLISENIFVKVKVKGNKQEINIGNNLHFVFPNH